MATREELALLENMLELARASGQEVNIPQGQKERVARELAQLQRKSQEGPLEISEMSGVQAKLLDAGLGGLDAGSDGMLSAQLEKVGAGDIALDDGEINLFRNLKRGQRLERAGLDAKAKTDRFKMRQLEKKLALGKPRRDELIRRGPQAKRMRGLDTTAGGDLGRRSQIVAENRGIVDAEGVVERGAGLIERRTIQDVSKDIAIGAPAVAPSDTGLPLASTGVAGITEGSALAPPIAAKPPTGALPTPMLKPIQDVQSVARAAAPQSVPIPSFIPQKPAQVAPPVMKNPVQSNPAVNAASSAGGGFGSFLKSLFF